MFTVSNLLDDDPRKPPHRNVTVDVKVAMLVDRITDMDPVG